MEEPQLKTLPVTLLKRRKHTNRDVFKAQRERAEQIRKRAKTRRSEIKRPAFFIAASRKRRRDEMRLKRVFKRKKPCMAADANRLGLIVRIKREEEEISKECLEILHLLRLDTYNLAVFVKVNQPMLELLSFIEPYIAWGYPSLQTVRDLLFKRGRTLIGRRSQSVDNQLIESRLGHHGILCLEDIIHELVTLGPNFRTVLGFLRPFKLMPPGRSWLSGSKRCRSVADRLTSMREENINEMVRRMI